MLGFNNALDCLDLMPGLCPFNWLWLQKCQLEVCNFKNCQGLYRELFLFFFELYFWHKGAIWVTTNHNRMMLHYQHFILCSASAIFNLSKDYHVFWSIRTFSSCCFYDWALVFWSLRNLFNFLSTGQSMGKVVKEYLKCIKIIWMKFKEWC